MKVTHNAAQVALLVGVCGSERVALASFHRSSQVWREALEALTLLEAFADGSHARLYTTR